MILFGVLFWVIFVIIVGVMAFERGRSVLGWVVLSIFFSPILGIILLLLLGPSEEKKWNKLLLKRLYVEKCGEKN